MKKIQAVSIWINGSTKQARILNAYAVNVTLGVSATFYYSLMAENIDSTMGEQLAQGNLSMTGQDYQDWADDAVAWDWIAAQLNLTITGDYVTPTNEETPIN